MRWILLTTLLLSCSGTANAEPVRKNVVLVIADDLGKTLGCYGDKNLATPNLDGLAAKGTLFTHGFACVASCSPSRSTILTGLHTHANGMYGLAHATHNQHSFERTRSLPSWLKEAGYRTGIVGKFHVQPKEVFPFDAVVSGKGGGRDVAGMVADCRKFVAEAGDKPFFLTVGFFDPHRDFGINKTFPEVPALELDPAKLTLPYHLSDHADTRSDLAEYYRAVHRLDHGVGLLLKMLEDTKVAANTLVIFVSDNGIPFPGAKTTLYDAGVHLPCIVRDPTRKRVGHKCDAMVSWADLAPTILDWCGAKPKDAPPGRSILPILEDESPKGWDEVFGSHQFHEITMYYPMRMVRTRSHKLILNIAHELTYPTAGDIYGSPTWQGVVKRKDKAIGARELAGYLKRPKWELYDLAKDPNELRNVADDAKYADVLADLRKRLRAWQDASKDPWIVKYTHE